MNFITGHFFKSICDYVLDEHGFRENQSVKSNNCPTFFVKTDYIHLFFNSNQLPNYEFNLITHNSDHGINHNHKHYLEYSYLKTWYAQNVDYAHSKLVPIPIGIANIEWPHGDVDILQNTFNINYNKEFILYANFNVHTNLKQRSLCLQNIDSQYFENNISFHEYTTKLAKTYFNVCPLGNGIDSHRIWESLYLKAIPIAENTYNIRYLKEKHQLPIYTIEHWSDIKNIHFTPELYNSLWHNFDSNQLDANVFKETII